MITDWFAVESINYKLQDLLSQREPPGHGYRPPIRPAALQSASPIWIRP